ncbi:MAG: hypothetical protein ACKPKO_30225, partial [Candidatus Fonsibacter sp.]
EDDLKSGGGHASIVHERENNADNGGNGVMYLARNNAKIRLSTGQVRDRMEAYGLCMSFLRFFSCMS